MTLVFSLRHLRALTVLTVCSTAACSASASPPAPPPPAALPTQAPAAGNPVPPAPDAHDALPAKPEPPKEGAPSADKTRAPGRETNADAKTLDEVLASGGRVYATARNNTNRELIVLCPNQTARYQGEHQDLSGRFERVGTKLTLHFGKKRKLLTISADAQQLTLTNKTELFYGKSIDCEQDTEMAPR